MLRCVLPLVILTATALPAQIQLTNGVPVPIVVPPQSTPRVLAGTEGFRLEIPAGTVNAWIQLEHVGDSPFLDLYVRRGSDVTSTGTQIAADFRATENSRLLRVTLLSGVSEQRIAPGTYFIAIGTSATVRAAVATLTARLVVTQPLQQGLEVRVPAIGTLNLAGFEPGRSGGGGSSPLNSPVLVPLAVRPGQVLEFDATGSVTTLPNDRRYTDLPPEGNFEVGGITGWDCCGVAVPAVQAPAGGLAGMFLADEYESQFPPRAYYWTIGTPYAPWIAPRLQQPFYIGNGFTFGGERKRFVVPPRATRLFLAVVDEFVGDNSGSFRVWVRTSTAVEPTRSSPVFVEAYRNISLGGRPAGDANGLTWAPLHSPVALPVTPGQRLRIVADGEAFRGDDRTGAPASPVGQLDQSVTVGVDCCGISIPAVAVPGSSLIGMFTAAALNNSLSVPRANFFTLGAREIQNVQPILQQPFYIGDGYTPDGSLKTFTVPPGATQLHLAAAVGSPANGGNGFVVSVSPENGAAPVIAPNGVVNAAGFVAGPLSPGSLASIFGANFGSQASAEAIPLPTTLGGTQVFVDDVLAPLVFVSAGQINFQIPSSFPDRGPWSFANSKRSALVTVVRNGIPSVAARIELQPFRPGVFEVARGQWVMFNARTGLLANETNPSREGDVLTIYASGVSPVSPPVATGAAAPVTEPLARSTFGAAFVTAQDGREAAEELLFSGLLPGFVGVHQLNARVPQGAPRGVVEVFVQSPFGRSNSGRMRVE